MKRFITVLLFLSISFFLFGIIAAGSHGHIMFRPHMIEDWFLWGAMLIAALLAIYFLLKRNR